MYKKSVVHVQSCCFANKTHCFLTFSLPSASLDLKVPIVLAAEPWVGWAYKSIWSPACHNSWVFWIVRSQAYGTSNWLVYLPFSRLRRQNNTALPPLSRQLRTLPPWLVSADAPSTKPPRYAGYFYCTGIQPMVILKLKSKPQGKVT